MIKATKHEWLKKAFYLFESRVIFPRRFRKLEINGIPILPNHSILLLQNHFSWWDGFFGSYLAYKFLKKSYHVMVQEDQLKRHFYFKYKGAFSIRKKSREIFESIEYSQTLLKNPDNMVLVFPQGKLQSIHTHEIKIEKGIYKLLENAPANCQVIYNAVVVNFFEGFKPSVSFHLLDCGAASSIQLPLLKQKLSDFHSEVLRSTVRQ